MKRLESQENKMSEVISTFKKFCELTANAINGIAQVLGNIKAEIDELMKFRQNQGNLMYLIDVIRDNYADQVIKINESVKSLTEVNRSIQQKIRHIGGNCPNKDKVIFVTIVTLLGITLPLIAQISHQLLEE